MPEPRNSGIAPSTANLRQNIGSLNVVDVPVRRAEVTQPYDMAGAVERIVGGVGRIAGTIESNREEEKRYKDAADLHQAALLEANTDPATIQRKPNEAVQDAVTRVMGDKMAGMGQKGQQALIRALSFQVAARERKVVHQGRADSYQQQLSSMETSFIRGDDPKAVKEAAFALLDETVKFGFDRSVGVSHVRQSFAAMAGDGDLARLQQYKDFASDPKIGLEAEWADAVDKAKAVISGRHFETLDTEMIQGQDASGKPLTPQEVAVKAIALNKQGELSPQHTRALLGSVGGRSFARQWNTLKSEAIERNLKAQSEGNLWNGLTDVKATNADGTEHVYTVAEQIKDTAAAGLERIATNVMAKVDPSNPQQVQQAQKAAVVLQANFLSNMPIEDVSGLPWSKAINGIHLYPAGSPQQTQALSLYKDLYAANPKLATRLVSSPGARDFLSNVMVSEAAGVSTDQAIAQAKDVSSDPREVQYRRDRMAKLPIDVNPHTRWYWFDTDTRNPAYVDSWIRSRSSAMVEAGATDIDAAKATATQEFMDNHTQVKGTWIPTSGVPANYKEIDLKLTQDFYDANKDKIDQVKVKDNFWGSRTGMPYGWGSSDQQTGAHAFILGNRVNVVLKPMNENAGHFALYDMTLGTLLPNSPVYSRADLYRIGAQLDADKLEQARKETLSSIPASIRSGSAAYTDGPLWSEDDEKRYMETINTGR